MSDLISHTRDDLVELPCDCEPAPHPCTCGSQYLCEVCNPRRSLIAAVRDISAVRDLPLYVWDDLLRPKAELISLAQERAIRARKRA
jgi:hypothetical protein